MKIIIEIECETIQDFYSHLSVLRKQIKKETKRLSRDFWKDDMPAEADLNDNNCYGDHATTILNDDAGYIIQYHNHYNP